MNKTNPILIIHRRNRLTELASLPHGCWVEIDIDQHEGTAYLVHDPITTAPARLDRLDDYLPKALAAGVAGFIFDCKRENVEQLIRPLVQKHGIRNYFYLNEMEVQADIFQEKNANHLCAMRVWQYRGADDVIRIADDMRCTGQTAPQWVWVDCWQRGLLEGKASPHLPLTGAQAAKLQTLGVRLCICSPELYAHKYNQDYVLETLEKFHTVARAYRTQLAEAGIQADAICTKFPQIWAD